LNAARDGVTRDAVELEKRDAIAIIRLNRPDQLNAFTNDMAARIIAAVDDCDSDDSVRAVVLTGAGRAFCAGADLEPGVDTFVLDDHGTGKAPPDEGGRVSLRIFRSMKPVVVAVNGPAAGVGATMILPADVRIASDTAKFGFVFSRRGLVPEACSTWFLPRVVGIATALEWCISGRLITAGEALDGGLVREVVPADRLLERAVEIAYELTAGTAPVSVAMTRQLLWQMLGAEGPEIAHAAESRAIFIRGRSADVREGVDAFLGKRTPNFEQLVSDGIPIVHP
jgi:enoyl-CoA hydratase/carnithine racemase